jgi:hypothetical protein
MSFCIERTARAESTRLHAYHRALAGAACHDRRSWKPHRLDTSAAGDAAELPRIDVVFCFRQCDNENQAGVKARHGPSPRQASICPAGPSPSAPVSFERKKNYCFAFLTPHLEHWPVFVDLLRTEIRLVNAAPLLASIAAKHNQTERRNGLQDDLARPVAPARYRT